MSVSVRRGGLRKPERDSIANASAHGATDWAAVEVETRRLLVCRCPVLTLCILLSLSVELLHASWLRHDFCVRWLQRGVAHDCWDEGRGRVTYYGAGCAIGRNGFKTSACQI